LRRLVADGVLGDVVRYESRFERWRPERKSGAWREELSATDGGGVLLDLGVHLVDQARQLLGPVSHVYAEVAARRGGSDDDVFVALRHSSGAQSHLWASAVSAAPGPRLRVLGSDAGFVVEHLDPQEDMLRAGGRPDDPSFGVLPPERWGRLVRGDAGEPVPSERGRWRTFYEDLVRALRLGEPPPVDPTDALRTLEVLEAARRSSDQSVVIAL
jgi:predicted dehydrogenase